MKAWTTRRKMTIIVTILLAALILFIAGWRMENSLPGSWSSTCEIKESIYLYDIIQIGNTKFITYQDALFGASPIHVLKSSDDCNWVEITSPTADHKLQDSSMILFRAPDAKLGIVWEERDSNDDNEPRTTFYQSIFDNGTWSEPEILLVREEGCILEDAIMLDNGSLLLLWNESLIMYEKQGDTMVRKSGCDITYRAYIDEDISIIEKVIEPGNAILCYTEGYSFLDDGERFWCIFYLSNFEDSLFRSWSEDGKIWSEPEPFNLPGYHSRQTLLTPHDEYGITCFNILENDFILYTSRDWEEWEKEKIFRSEEGIIGATILFTDTGEMWGVLDTSSGMLLIQPSQESEQRYHQKMTIVHALRYMASGFIGLAMIGFLVWVWKRS